MTIYLPTVLNGNCCQCRGTDICGQNHYYTLCAGQCTPSGIGSIVKACSIGAYIIIEWRGGRYHYYRGAATSDSETAHTVVSTAASCPDSPPEEPADWHHCFAGCCAGRSHLIISDDYFKSIFPADANDPDNPTASLCVKDSDGCCYCGHSYVVNPISHTSGVQALSDTSCSGCDNSDCPYCVLCHIDICLEPLLQTYSVSVSGIEGENSPCKWWSLNGGASVQNVFSSPCVWVNGGYPATYYNLEWTGSIWRVTAFSFYGWPSSTCKVEARWTLSSDPCDPRGVAVWQPGDYAALIPIGGGPCYCSSSSAEYYIDGATCVVS